MTWKKLPAVENPGYRSGCLNCGPQPTIISLETELAMGFGSATVTKDDLGIYDDGMVMRGEDCPTLRKFEELAKADPDHDWRVHFYGAMSETHYQRHGDGEWVLVLKGEGFA